TQIENALDDHVYDMDTYTSAVAGASTPMASHLHDSSAVGNGDKVPVDRPSIDFGSLEMLRQR
ncbi:MAG: hypothetical protein PF636_11445, partial [Actinomycetota bacterium]|nr:hypothetical protein [Actinomycetota bacterium]